MNWDWQRVADNWWFIPLFLAFMIGYSLWRENRRGK